MNTEIICILDRSGSMRSTLHDAIGGFNQFLHTQRDEPGEARITTILFNQDMDTIYTGIPLADAPEMDPETWFPMGRTALLDTLGFGLLQQSYRMSKDLWADKVIVCILTDGLENASSNFKLPAVAAMIKEKEAEGWSFVFLGANQDAFHVADSMGMSPDNVMNYEATGLGTRDAFLRMSRSSSELRRARNRREDS